MSHHRPPRRDEQLDALLACPLIHGLAEDIAEHVTRARRHPIALHLAYGAMSRLWHSGNRLDAELAHAAYWNSVTERYNRGATDADGELLHHVNPPLTAHTYRHARELLTRPAVFDDLLESFSARSVSLARDVGLLREDGGGSRTRPAAGRSVFGDGTIVRPMYRPENTGRRDPDAAEHHNHTGAHWGNNLVMLAVRGKRTHQRVVLAVDRVREPGLEATTAVDLFRRVHRYAGEGMQAAVYDGAFRGVHHQTLMAELGVVVVNKVHPARRTRNNERGWRTVTLGNWSHGVGRRSCTHTLVARGGSVHESQLDDSGQLILSAPLERAQVRRYEAGRDEQRRFRFALGVRVPCPKAPFTAWISPHPEPGDTTFGRPDQLRLVTPDDPLFPVLYGLRNDSEAINAAYKATLPFDRAAVRGWRRQVLDLMSWALLTNSLAWAEHRQDTASAVAA